MADHHSTASYSRDSQHSQFLLNGQTDVTWSQLYNFDRCRRLSNRQEFKQCLQRSVYVLKMLRKAEAKCRRPERVLYHNRVPVGMQQCTDLYNNLLVYAFPVLLILCLFGNGYNLLIYRLKCFKGSHAVHLLRFKAIANIGFLCSLIFEMIHSSSLMNDNDVLAAQANDESSRSDGRFVDDMMTPVWNPSLEHLYWHSKPYFEMFANFFGAASTWCTLLITIQTIICIGLPHQYRQICASRNIIGGILFTIFLSLVLSISIPIVRETKLEFIGLPTINGTSTISSNNDTVCRQRVSLYNTVKSSPAAVIQTYERAYYWVHAVMIILLPILCMLICSLLVKGLFPIERLGDGFTQRRKVVLQITYATTVGHLVLEGPGLLVVFVGAIYGSSLDSQGGRTQLVTCILATVTNFLAVINATIPFLIYFIINRQFRYMSLCVLRFALPESCFPHSLGLSGSGIALQQTMNESSRQMSTRSTTLTNAAKKASRKLISSTSSGGSAGSKTNSIVIRTNSSSVYTSANDNELSPPKNGGCDSPYAQNYSLLRTAQANSLASNLQKQHLSHQTSVPTTENTDNMVLRRHSFVQKLQNGYHHWLQQKVVASPKTIDKSLITPTPTATKPNPDIGSIVDSCQDLFGDVGGGQRIILLETNQSLPLRCQTITTDGSNKPTVNPHNKLHQNRSSPLASSSGKKNDNEGEEAMKPLQSDHQKQPFQQSSSYTSGSGDCCETDRKNQQNAQKHPSNEDRHKLTIVIPPAPAAVRSGEEEPSAVTKTKKKQSSSFKRGQRIGSQTEPFRDHSTTTNRGAGFSRNSVSYYSNRAEDRDDGREADALELSEIEKFVSNLQISETLRRCYHQRSPSLPYLRRQSLEYPDLIQGTTLPITLYSRLSVPDN